MSDFVATRPAATLTLAHSRESLSLLPCYLFTALGLPLLAMSGLTLLPEAMLPGEALPDGLGRAVWPGGVLVGGGIWLGLRNPEGLHAHDPVAGDHARAQFSQAAMAANLLIGIACLFAFSGLGWCWNMPGMRTWFPLAAAAVAGLGAAWYGVYSLRGLLYLAANRDLPRCTGDARDLERDVYPA